MIPYFEFYTCILDTNCTKFKFCDWPQTILYLKQHFKTLLSGLYIFFILFRIKIIYNIKFPKLFNMGVDTFWHSEEETWHLIPKWTQIYKYSWLYKNISKIQQMIQIINLLKFPTLFVRYFNNNASMLPFF